jgi:hypothetical protein
MHVTASGFRIRIPIETNGDPKYSIFLHIVLYKWLRERTGELYSID